VAMGATSVLPRTHSEMGSGAAIECSNEEKERKEKLIRPPKTKNIYFKVQKNYI